MLELIRTKKAKVCVVGLGYVGLPLAVILAKRGFKVIGADINPKVVNCVNKGISHINEPGLEKLLKEVAGVKLFATTNVKQAVRESNVIIIVVQTPIDENKNPNLKALKNACKTVGESLRRNSLVIIESTVPPKATKEIIIPLLEIGKLKAGKDFYLAYSPERAMPTRTLEEMQTNSRVIGGINEESMHLAKELYASITTGELILTDITTAEVVKVIENTYRDVNIALANEIALLCEKLKVDAIKAISIANKHPRVNIHLPGAGVGGHCLPKDPYFLIKKAEEFNLKLNVIEAARKTNENMPSHVVKLVEKALKKANKDLKNAKVSILGLAYKGNTDDTRETPARKIIYELRNKCRVFSHDPIVTQDFGEEFSNDLEKILRNADCLVIVTDHDVYKSLDLQKIKKLMSEPCIIIDGRRVIDPEKAKKYNIEYYGIGY